MKTKTTLDKKAEKELRTNCVVQDMQKDKNCSLRQKRMFFKTLRGVIRRNLEKDVID